MARITAQHPLLPIAVLCVGIVVLAMDADKSYADCGDYVIIGNVAKRKELQAAGYLPPMRHDRNRSTIGESSNGTADRNEREKPHVDSPRSRNSRIPAKPCSGPGCRSRNSSIPVSPPVIISIEFEKSIGHGGEPTVHDDRVMFVGFRVNDETPRSGCFLLDRPPE